MGTVYTQLSYQERRKIEDWWLAKVPVAEMAHPNRSLQRRTDETEIAETVATILEITGIRLLFCVPMPLRNTEATGAKPVEMTLHEGPSRCSVGAFQRQLL